jgi:hypothetical protein
MKSYTQIWKTRNLTVKGKTYLFPKWDTKLKPLVQLEECKASVHPSIPAWLTALG